MYRKLWKTYTKLPISAKRVYKISLKRGVISFELKLYFTLC